MISSALWLLALVPIGIGCVAAPMIRRASQHIRPGVATVLLTGLALSVSLVTGLLLCLAAVVVLFELLPAFGLDHWSPVRLRHLIPIPAPLGLATGMTAVALIASAALHLLRVGRQLHRTGQAAAALPVLGHDLVLLQDENLIAYAVPGRHRRIVVSVGLLRVLTGAERRALLAHEAAHLEQRHHLYVQLGRLAAAANPLVRPISRSIDLAVERWADDAAAHEVGDRLTVARAVARAAATVPVDSPVGALGLAEADVVTRVRMLLQPQRSGWVVALTLVTGILCCWGAAALIVGQVHNLMELAESTARR